MGCAGSKVGAENGRSDAAADQSTKKPEAKLIHVKVDVGSNVSATVSQHDPLVVLIFGKAFCDRKWALLPPFKCLSAVEWKLYCRSVTLSVSNQCKPSD
jgi:hypothetical protein